MSLEAVGVAVVAAAILAGVLAGVASFAPDVVAGLRRALGGAAAAAQPEVSPEAGAADAGVGDLGDPGEPPGGQDRPPADIGGAAQPDDWPFTAYLPLIQAPGERISVPFESASMEHDSAHSVTLRSVRSEGRGAVALSQMADGTWRVTLKDEGRLGAEIGFGGIAQILPGGAAGYPSGDGVFGGGNLAVGGGSDHTWIFADREEAERYAASLEIATGLHGPWPAHALPQPLRWLPPDPPNLVTHYVDGRAEGLAGFDAAPVGQLNVETRGGWRPYSLTEIRDLGWVAYRSTADGAVSAHVGVGGYVPYPWPRSSPDAQRRGIERYTGSFPGVIARWQPEAGLRRGYQVITDQSTGEPLRLTFIEETTRREAQQLAGRSGKGPRGFEEIQGGTRDVTSVVTVHERHLDLTDPENRELFDLLYDPAGGGVYVQRDPGEGRARAMPAELRPAALQQRLEERLQADAVEHLSVYQETRHESGLNAETNKPPIRGARGFFGGSSGGGETQRTLVSSEILDNRDAEPQWRTRPAVAPALDTWPQAPDRAPWAGPIRLDPVPVPGPAEPSPPGSGSTTTPTPTSGATTSGENPGDTLPPPPDIVPEPAPVPEPATPEEDAPPTTTTPTVPSP